MDEESKENLKKILCKIFEEAKTQATEAVDMGPQYLSQVLLGLAEQLGRIGISTALVGIFSSDGEGNCGNPECPVHGHLNRPPADGQNKDGASPPRLAPPLPGMSLQSAALMPSPEQTSYTHLFR